jgi:hypothetical protein
MFHRQISSNDITDATLIGGVPHSLFRVWPLGYQNPPATTVKVVNICRWLDFTYGLDWSNRPDYETTGKALMAWCEANDSHYYARCREDFSEPEALIEAVEAGKTTVVVEDMS